MKKEIQHAGRYFLYLIKAKHRRGHGVHSPFAFDLITNIIEEKHPYYNHSTIEAVREELLSNKKIIHVLDFGTKKSRKRKVSDIAVHSLKKKKYAQLLFRLVNVSNPEIIIELGTSLGLTTAYLASVNSKSICYSLEGCPQIASVANTVLRNCQVSNVDLRVGNIDETLPALLDSLEKVDFVFFDANHTKDATLRYFNLCLNKITEKTIFVFDDIHHSSEMEAAWIEIINNKEAKVSFDLFELGIIYFNKELRKQSYILRF